MSNLPSFPLHRILRVRRRIRDGVLAGGEAAAPDWAELCEKLSRVLRCSKDVVLASVQPYIGRPLTAELRDQIAWHLAGNQGRLQRGRPVGPWTVQREQEWVPLHTVRVVKLRDRGRVGYRASFRVLAGTPAGLVISHFWSASAIGLVARRVGFTHGDGLYPFSRGVELVGLRMLALLDPERSYDLPGFRTTDCSPGLIRWNRKNVLSIRVRRPGHPCPFSYRHPCWRCVVGFVDCPAGTHRYTYEIGECPTCGKETVFDVEDETRECVSCAAAARLRRTEDTAWRASG